MMDELQGVEENIVVQFDNEACACAVSRDPAKPHDAFEREVVVCVEKVALHQISVLMLFRLQTLLQGFVGCLTQQERRTKLRK